MATDEHCPSAAPAPPANARQVARTEVAVGILQRADNALLSPRSLRIHLGYWEFPGGKLGAAKLSSRPCVVNSTRSWA